MGKEIVRRSRGRTLSRDLQRDIAERYFASLNPNTRAAYEFAWNDFASFLEVPTIAAALGMLLEASHGGANGIAFDYQQSLNGRGLAANTVNQRLSALRSLISFMRRLGRVNWSLDVDGEKSKAYRDTRGPVEEDRDKLMDTARRRAARSNVGKRDFALVKLMDNPFLRRAECVALDLEHVRLAECEVFVIGKGRTQGEWLGMPEQTRDAVRDWIAARGNEPGPLFIRLDPGASDELERITLRMVNKMLKHLSAKAGVPKVRPHGLRHGGITRALDRGVSLRDVGAVARHLDPKVTRIYDDNRQHAARRAAQFLADSDAARERAADKD